MYFGGNFEGNFRSYIASKKVKFYYSTGKRYTNLHVYGTNYIYLKNVGETCCNLDR